jgi:hypothetical protein
MLRALIIALLLAAPAHAGPYLSGEGHTVRILQTSQQLEVISGARNRGADAYFCAAAQAAAARLDARGTDRLRIEGMPRGGTGALFTLLRGAAPNPGIRILGKRGSTLSVAASGAFCHS